VGEEKDVFFRPVGLVLDPSERLAPQGSFRRAENVSLKRQGILEARPGFPALYSAQYGPAGVLVRQMFPYGGTLKIAGESSGTWTHYWRPSTAISGIGNPPTGRYPKNASMRKSLYTTSSTGLKKLTGTSDTVAEAAGVEILQGQLALSSAGTPVLLAAGYTLAYRWCIRRTDANNYIRRSAATAWRRIYNSAGVTRDVTVTCPLPTTAVAGDVIELYRSVATASPTLPSDELYLAREYIITSSDITAQAVALLDTTLAADLGAALYSNATELGAAAAKEIPPLARDVAEFGGCLFYGYATSRQRAIAEMTQVGGSSGTYTGIKRVATTGIASGGSATLTSVADTSQIRVGMLVVDNGTEPTADGPYVLADSVVLSKTANTVVMSRNASAGSGGAVTFQFCDVVSFGDVDFYAWSAELTGKRSFLCDSSSTNSDRVRVTAQSLAYVVNLCRTADVPKATTLADPTGAQGLMVFEERGVGGAGFTFSSTAADGWSVDAVVGVPSTVNDFKSTSDGALNRLMWSSIDEPEAVPIANYADVGDALKEIIRIVPTRDALFIFKQDGCWKLTGTYPFWRIDKHDPILLLAEDGVTVFEDQVVAWTERGVVVGGLSGFESISRDTIEFDIVERQIVDAAYPASPYRASMAAIVSDGLLVFGVAASGTDGKASKLYVFSAKTHGWTTWELTPRCTVYDPADCKLNIGSPGTVYNVHKEKKVEGSAYNNADAEYAITLTGISGSTVVIDSGATSYSPAIGDLIYQVTGEGVVTAVPDSTHATLDVITGLDTSGKPAMAYRGYDIILEAIGVDAQDPSCLKQFARIEWIFEDTRYTHRALFNSRTDSDLTGGGTEEASQTRPTSAQYKAWAWVVPRISAHGTRIYPYLYLKSAACTRAKISGFAIRYTRLEGVWR